MAAAAGSGAIASGRRSGSKNFSVEELAMGN
jgi:hypothetical protein